MPIDGEGSAAAGELRCEPVDQGFATVVPQLRERGLSPSVGISGREDYRHGPGMFADVSTVENADGVAKGPDLNVPAAGPALRCEELLRCFLITAATGPSS